MDRLEERKQLVKDLTNNFLEREKADFNLQEIIDSAVTSLGNEYPKWLIDNLVKLLRDLGPDIFEIGFLSGMEAGLELSLELNRLQKKQQW